MPLRGGHRRLLDGVGFVLTAALGIAGWDLDHVVDAHGRVAPTAQPIVDELCTYTECSPSGTGLRIICRATLPPGWRNTSKALPFRIEAYADARYLDVRPATCSLERRPTSESVTRRWRRSTPAWPHASGPPLTTR